MSVWSVATFDRSGFSSRLLTAGCQEPGLVFDVEVGLMGGEYSCRDGLGSLLASLGRVTIAAPVRCSGVDLARYVELKRERLDEQRGDSGMPEQRFVLVGWSLGTKFNEVFARTHPDYVEAVIEFGPPGPRLCDRDADELRRTVSRSVRISNDLHDLARFARDMTTMLTTRPALFKTLCQLAVEEDVGAAAPSVPSLVLRGSNDPLCTPAVARERVAIWGDEWSGMNSIDGHDHLLGCAMPPHAVHLVESFAARFLVGAKTSLGSSGIICARRRWSQNSVSASSSTR